jgi:hypothetical protein
VGNEDCSPEAVSLIIIIDEEADDGPDQDKKAECKTAIAPAPAVEKAKFLFPFFRISGTVFFNQLADLPLA